MKQQQQTFLQKLPETIAAITDKKVELSQKKAQVWEAKRTKADKEFVTQLEFEWGFLETEINGLESVANVMRKNLVRQPCLEVNSVEEMKVVNELRLGVGAGAEPHDMPRFTGEIHVSEDLPVAVVNGIHAAAKAREIF